MNSVQTNRVNMFKTVSSYLGEHDSIWNGMEPFALAVQEFNDKVESIDSSAQKQETPTGSSEDKAAARHTLEDRLFLMCEALGFIAHTTSAHGLSALTNLRPSDLDRLGDEELTNRATSVLTEANANKTQLATLQVTQTNIDEFDQALTAFKTAKAAPRTATADRMAQTAALPVLIRDAGNILRNQLDRLVNLFRRTNPEFVSGYRGARVVVDRGVRHRTVQPVSPPPTPAGGGQ